MDNWNWLKYDHDIMMEPDSNCAYLAERWSGLGGNKLLELGSGMGQNSLYFACSGYDVTAVDYDSYAIKHLEKMCERQGVKVNTICDDFFKAPLKDGGYDCVFIRNVVSHQKLSEFKKLIQLIYDCLRVGGEAYITVPSVGHAGSERNPKADLVLTVEDVKKYFKKFQFVHNIDEVISHDAGCDNCEECEISYFTLLLRKMK